MDNETKQVIIDISPLVISERFDIRYLLEVPVDPALVLEKYPVCDNGRTMIDVLRGGFWKRGPLFVAV